MGWLYGDTGDGVEDDDGFRSWLLLGGGWKTDVNVIKLLQPFLIFASKARGLTLERGNS
jgi:hypothetical protein